MKKKTSNDASAPYIKQNYPNLEVIIAINDRSDDKTGQIMDTHRLTIQREDFGSFIIDIFIRSWLGKSHAMHQGMKLATGDIWFFTDADCFFQCPDTYKSAYNTPQTIISICSQFFPYSKPNPFGSGSFKPVCRRDSHALVPTGMVNNPQRKVAYANGAFLLFQRPATKKFKATQQSSPPSTKIWTFAKARKANG
jgi:glycosyltransferase involved in cell wall biosynthesis